LVFCQDIQIFSSQKFSTIKTKSTKFQNFIFYQHISGKYGKDRRAEQGRLVGDDMYQKRYGEQWMYDAAVKFAQFARGNGYHPVSLAVAWATHHPAVTAPIIGARDIEQLKDSLQSVDIEISPDLYGAICRLTPKPPPATDRSEIFFQ
jgi:aryl-alcohol dehydrogenase-like predicted oxidoreductase